MKGKAENLLYETEEKSHKADHRVRENFKIMKQKDDLNVKNWWSLMLKIILSYSRDYMVRKVKGVAIGKAKITFLRIDFHISAVESHVEKIWTPLIIKKRHIKKKKNTITEKNISFN